MNSRHSLFDSRCFCRHRCEWAVIVACACATVVLVGPSSGSEGNFLYPVADADACGPESSRGERILACKAREHGAKIHPHVAVAHFESALEAQDGRQIVATRAIANESALLEIPSALHMSVKQLRGHAQLGKSRLPFSLSLSPLSCSWQSDEMRHSGPTLAYALGHLRADLHFARQGMSTHTSMT